MNVAVRELWRGRVWRVFPMRLVERRPDGGALLWSPAGTPVLRPFAGEVQLRIPGDVDWDLRVRPSNHQEVAIVVPGRRYGLWHVFRDGVFREWYVNLERESRWNGACFDMVDEKLDLVVSAAGEVRWKDEDELAAAAAQGFLDAAEVRAEAERVLADPPWPTGLERFAPDPAWPTPELPAGWDVAPLETPRLRLAPLTAADGDAYRRLEPDADAEVALSEQHWREHCFGPWAVLDESGFAGVIEVHHAPAGVEGIGTDEIEVGWSLAADRRGRGVATEAARAAIDDAWARTGADHLVAYIRPQNEASLRLAERLGFRLRGDGRSRSGDPVAIVELRP